MLILEVVSNFMTYLGPWIGGTISFILIVAASWSVGEGGEILGKKYDSSIVGGLIIAWLNTAPEAIFFVTALQSNNPRFAIGAVSGSTIVVSTIALGVCYYFGTQSRGGSFIIQKNVKRQCLILAITSIIPVLIAIFGFSKILGAIGIVSYFLFLIWELVKDKIGALSASSVLNTIDILEDFNLDNDDESSHEDLNVTRGVVYLLIGGGLIFLFSEPFIHAVSQISTILGINPILLAFFLAPVASEMPEILESISLSRKGKLQNINIAVSNLMGGTITKTTLLCGIFCYSGVSMGFDWESPNYTLSMLLISICTTISGCTGYFFKEQKLWHAIILIILFICTGTVQYLFNSTFTTESKVSITPL